MFGKQTFCGNTLEEPHDLTDAVPQIETHHMHIVLVITKLFDGSGYIVI